LGLVFEHESDYFSKIESLRAEDSCDLYLNLHGRYDKAIPKNGSLKAFSKSMLP